jgi:methionyl-tRNA formyltransferase
MTKKRVLFIGNRPGVLREIVESNMFEITKIFALKDSFLERSREEFPSQKSFSVFDERDTQHVIKQVQDGMFDFLVSNGCPFIIPVSKIRKPHQIFINVHPGYLPHLKGKTPINGVFYNEMDFFGATAHLMDDGIDTGPVLYQEKQPVTQDMDLGLLYFLNFELERVVMRKVINHYSETGQLPQQHTQIQGGSYFNRKPEMQLINFTEMGTSELIKRIRAFGIKGQGCISNLNGSRYIIYEATVIENPFVILLFKERDPGTILHQYDNKLLVKTRNGMIKINRYESADD